VANGKHRKQHIFILEQEDGVIVGDLELKKYITNYYKNLFGKPDEIDISLVESRIDDIPHVTDAENDTLISVFTEIEVKEAVFQMEHNKAPGPDGFLAEFFQVFWEIIKEDLMALFKDFHEERLPLYSLNFGVITLLPKIVEAKQIQQYKLICVLNVCFKILTKVCTNSLNRIAQKVVSPSQTAFMPGRNIMEGVVILHETIHELHTKKQDGVIFKIDFEKAYDKVKWSFLQQTLRMKGFSPKWCRWVEGMIKGVVLGSRSTMTLAITSKLREGLDKATLCHPSCSI
jgi:hypothetical protein